MAGVVKESRSQPGAPIATSDPVNARILAVSEDKLQGFHAIRLGRSPGRAALRRRW